MREYNKSMKTLFIALALVVCESAFSNEDLPPVKPGDVIVSVNGKRTKNNLAAMKIISSAKPGSHIVMEVLRDNKIQKVNYEAK